MAVTEGRGRRTNPTIFWIIVGAVAAICPLCLSLAALLMPSRADRLWSAGRKEEAVGRYIAAIERSPPSEWVYVYQRVIDYYSEKGNWPRVVHYYDLAKARRLDVRLPTAAEETYAKTKNDAAIAVAKKEQEKQRLESVRLAGSAEMKYSAWEAAEKLVKDRLKSPSSASFGTFWGESQEPEKQVKYLGNGRYSVTGWVDSQNSFGAMIRADFAVIVKSEGQTWYLDAGPVIKSRN